MARGLRAAALFGAALLAWGCASLGTSRRHGPALGVAIARSALAQRGRPYVFGGDRPGRGFDCSGLAYWSFGRHGVDLPRTVAAMARVGRHVPLRDLRAGDLVFFSPYGGRPTHVGVMLDRYRFVHAPSSGERVRVDSLRNPYWRRVFVGARRVT